MTETKKYNESYNENKKIDFSKLNDTELWKIMGESKYNYDWKEFYYKSLPKDLKLFIGFSFRKPAFIAKFGVAERFEKYVQEKTWFKQDITSENFSKEALKSYFIEFIKSIKKDDRLYRLVNENILKVEMIYKWQKYKAIDVIFELLFPMLVDYYVVINWVKKDVDDFKKDIKK